MKKLILVMMLIPIMLSGFAQENHPVSWKLSSEKIGPLTYKIKIEARVEAPFHIYPQQSSGGGMGMPTEFLFAEDANIEFVGDVEEKGLEDKGGKEQEYYAKGATFTQQIKLKSEKNTSLAVTIKYMACTDRYCLAPSRKQFTLSVNSEGTAAAELKVLGSPAGEKMVFTYEDFTMADVGGKLISSKEITSKSRYTFIDFWASWCIPCRAQGRELIPIYNAYRSKGFSVIGVSLDTNPTAWKKAIEVDRYTWTNVTDLKGFESLMAKRYGITAIPRNFLIDNEGNIVAKDLHGKELETKLADLFGE